VIQKGDKSEPGHYDVDDKVRKIIFPVFMELEKSTIPLLSPDNKSLFFLSNRDGFRNLYRYSIDSAKNLPVIKIFVTGISGHY